MYQHILVSTDGSKLSRKAIVTAVNLARAVGWSPSSGLSAQRRNAAKPSGSRLSATDTI